MCRFDGAVPCFGFSTICGDARDLGLGVLDADDAVLVGLVFRHRRDGDVVAAVLLVGLDHLGQAGLWP